MKRLYQNFKCILFLISSFIAIPYISSAQKILGAEITYHHLDGDSFQVNLKTYLLCDSTANAFAPGKLTVKPEKSNSFTVALNSDGNGGTDITPVSAKTCTPCNTKSCAFGYGVQMYSYYAIVKLSGYTECNFTFSWQGKNRKINGENIYLEATINKCLTFSSPIYTNAPVFITCLKTCNSLSFGAISNHWPQDSLSYSLVNARKAKDSIYSYAAGYDSLKPMSVSTSASDYPCNGFAFDVETGFANFKPTKIEDAVLAIKTIQWLKDSTGIYRQSGSIMQDLQLTVMDCDSNNLPVVTGINGGNQTLMEFCAYQQKCLTINTYDLDSLTDTITLSSNVNMVIPNASLSIETGKKFPKATFCWTPYNSEAQTYPYKFTIYATDNNSPINGRTQKTFSIKVNPAPEAYYSVKQGSCGEVTFQAFPGKTAAISSFEWTAYQGKGNGSIKGFGNPVKIKYPSPYTNMHAKAFIYTLTVTSVNGCKAFYLDSILIKDNYLWIELPKDTAVCINSTMDIVAKPHNGKPDILYNWSTDLPGTFIKNKTKLSLIKITKDTTIWVTIKDASGCTNSDTIHIHAQKPSKPNLGPDITGCNTGANSVILRNLDTTIKAKSVQWFKYIDSTGGSLPVSTSNAFEVKDSGKYWVLITDVVGCTGTDTINVSLNPLIDVEKKTVKACDKDSVTLVGGTANAGSNWIWQDKRYINLGLIQHVGPSYKLQAKTFGSSFFKTEYIVTVTQKANGLTCKDVDTITLETYTKPTVTAASLPRLCANAVGYDLSLVNSQPSSGQNWWTYSKSDIDVISGNILNPSVLGAGNHYIYYWHKDAVSGCTGFDSSLLELYTLPKVFAGNDTFLCMTDNLLYLDQIHNLTPSTGGKWRAEDYTTVDLIQGTRPYFHRGWPGSYKLIYSTQDSTKQCFNEDTIVLTVYPELTVYGGRYDTVCNSISQLYLDGSPAGGSWQAGSPDIIKLDTSGAYYFLPFVAGAGRHKLWYTASHSKGACPQTDTIYITVDSNCVWPGDANLDKTADYLDILDIALGYSTVGTPRVNASTDWIPQASNNWINTLSSGINYKHLDTNGDSVIDADDTFAVAKNYGKTHLKNEEPQLAGNPNDPPLYFQYNKNYYLAGDTVKAILYLGSADKPVKDVYGLGLKHFFANPYMQPNSYKFNWDCEIFCGAKDNFQLYRQFNDKNIGEGSIIRTDKMTTSNTFGKVAEIAFTLKDSTFNYPKAGVNISMQILKSKLIDMSGNEILVYTKADSVKVYRTKNDVVGVKENSKAINADIKIYPNPANNLVYIDGGTQHLNEISIINILGETVAFVANSQTSKTSINIQNLSSGIYFVRVKTGANFNQYKLIISR